MDTHRVHVWRGGGRKRLPIKYFFLSVYFPSSPRHGKGKGGRSLRGGLHSPECFAAVLPPATNGGYAPDSLKKHDRTEIIHSAPA